MSYNPFANRLVIPEYDTVNIKKIYDVFPRLLRVKQLTSDQLLEELRRQLQQRDVRIEELLNLLDRLRNQTTSFDDLQDLIQQLSGTLGTDLEAILQGLLTSVGDAQKQSKVDSLLNRGFIRIGESDLFVKVNSTDDRSRVFYLRSDNEKNGGDLNLVSPTSPVTFANASDENRVYFFKREFWNYTSEKYENIENRFDGDPFPPTNIFVFQRYKDLYRRTFSIAPGEEVTTSIIEPYFDKSAKSAFKDAGLKRDDSGGEATWKGSMYIYASSTDQSIQALLSSGDYASIGDITLYRKFKD